MQFDGIIAVSKKDSHRRSSLIHAANLTGIEILIPDQPLWTDEDVESVKTDELSLISRGSAMAWLGHLNALRWYVWALVSHKSTLLKAPVTNTNVPGSLNQASPRPLSLRMMSTGIYISDITKYLL
jgi:hypothetical protein